MPATVGVPTVAKRRGRPPIDLESGALPPNLPVSFKVRADTYRSLRRVATHYDLSVSEIVEWALDEIAALHDAGRISVLRRDKRSLAIVALDEPTYDAAVALAARGRLALAEWLRSIVEHGVSEQMGATAPAASERSPGDDPPISTSSWASVVAAMRGAVEDGTDVVGAFYRAFPWHEVPHGVAMNDAALLRRAMLEIDFDAAIRAQSRRALARRTSSTL